MSADGEQAADSLIQDQDPSEVKPEEKTVEGVVEKEEAENKGDIEKEEDGKEEEEEAKELEKLEAEAEKPKVYSKIEIRLQATGDAPIMKQRNYKVEPAKKISEIIAFVRKYLKLDEKENLFLYVNQAFAPSPDQTILNLHECFGSEGKLVLYYSRNQAWG